MSDSARNEKIDLSIVIPTYNEAFRIANTMAEIAKYIKTKKITVELIIVDAQSPDGTAVQAKKNAKLFDHFLLIDAGPKPTKKAIKGRQVKLGMLASRGEYVVFMDADLATPLKYLDDVIELAQKNRPIGICVRNLQKSHTGLRKLISGGANFLVQLLILPGIKDTQCGFKAFEHSAAQNIFAKQTVMGWGFDMEVLAIARQQGYQIETINVPDWRDIKEGSKVSSSKFSAAKAALQTFPDLIRIKWGLMTGKYKKVTSEELAS